jgi:Ion transport protein
LQGFGQFSTENFETNNSKSLAWLYFLAATFLTQLMFFNMLIANMGTTYNRVQDEKEISILMMRTKMLANNIHLLSFSKTFGD